MGISPACRRGLSLGTAGYSLRARRAETVVMMSPEFPFLPRVAVRAT